MTSELNRMKHRPSSARQSRRRPARRHFVSTRRRVRVVRDQSLFHPLVQPSRVTVAAPRVSVQIQQTQDAGASKPGKGPSLDGDEFVVGQLQVLQVVETGERVHFDPPNPAIVQLQFQQFRMMLEGSVGKGLEPIPG